MDWQLVIAILPQVVMDGLVLGFMYALIALGYTMVYGVLELINFAHSDLHGGRLRRGRGPLAAQGRGPPRSAQRLPRAGAHRADGHGRLGAPGSGDRAGGLPAAARRPSADPAISAIGVSFFLQDAVRLVESLWRNAFYLTYPSFPAFNRRIELGETIDFSVKSILVVLASLFMLFALQFLVNRTKLGKAIRAVAEDQPTASLMGINVNRIIS